MKNKNGFTLIELLAVIIILGILMIIAIPSVTRYISDSRKSAYVNTAKEVISATRNLVNSGELEMYDTDVTYYIPNSCIKVENGEKAKSPYGEFIDDKTYVVVTYTGSGYEYYWVSLDETGTGVVEPKGVDELEEKYILSDVKREDIKDNLGMGGRSRVIIYNSDCSESTGKDAYSDAICKRAIELHTDVCHQSNTYGCAGVVGSGKSFTYGNLGTDGILTAGDAFDCDVNGDGEFNSENERFYYLTTDNDDNLIFLFYNNYDGTNPNHYSFAPYYELEKENWHGPVSAISLLPTETQWSNVKLINKIRNIFTDANGKITSGGTLPDTFDYGNHVARLLSISDIEAACGSGSKNKNYFLNCIYFLENTKYSDSHQQTIYQYWIENPYSSNAISAMSVSMTNVNVGYSGVQSNNGIRPVIEVSKSKVDY